MSGLSGKYGFPWSVFFISGNPISNIEDTAYARRAYAALDLFISLRGEQYILSIGDTPVNGNMVITFRVIQSQTCIDRSMYAV